MFSTHYYCSLVVWRFVEWDRWKVMGQTEQKTSKPRLDRDSLHEKSNFLSDSDRSEDLNNIYRKRYFDTSPMNPSSNSCNSHQKFFINFWGRHKRSLAYLLRFCQHFDYIFKRNKSFLSYVKREESHSVTLEHLSNRHYLIYKENRLRVWDYNP